MKYMLFAAFIAATFSSCCGSRSAQGSKIPLESLPSLQEVVAFVQFEYQKAIDSLGKNGVTDVEVTGAEVTFKVAKEVAASGQMKVLIIKGSKERTESKSTSVTFKLTQEKSDKGAGDEKTKLIGTNLRDIIFLAGKQYSKLENPLQGLIKDGFDIDIVFSIDRKAGGGLSFEVWKIEAEAGVDYTHSVEHELKLTFGYKKS